MGNRKLLGWPWIAIASCLLVLVMSSTSCTALRDSPQDALTRDLSRKATEGDLGAVRQLVERGAKVNAQHPDGTRPTALHSAALYVELNPNGQLPIVKYLLAQGANVNSRDGKGDTPLMLVTGSRDTPLSIIRLLLDCGADPNLQGSGQRTALMFAVSADHVEAVRELVRRGCRLDSKNYAGQTALKVAYIRAASPEILKILKAPRAK